MIVHSTQRVTNKVISSSSSVNCASQNNTVSDRGGRVTIFYKHQPLQAGWYSIISSK